MSCASCFCRIDRFFEKIDKVSLEPCVTCMYLATFTLDPPIPNFIEICQVVAEMKHANGQAELAFHYVFILCIFAKKHKKTLLSRTFCVPHIGREIFHDVQGTVRQPSGLNCLCQQETCSLLCTVKFY
jgi:hypothetical protein